MPMYKQYLKNIFMVAGFSFVFLLCGVFFTSHVDAQTKVDEINNSLKNVIEENQSLSAKNQDLQKELEQLKKEQTEYNQLKKDRDDLSDSAKRYRETNERYSKQIKKLETDLEDLGIAKRRNDRKIQELESELLLYREETLKKNIQNQSASLETTEDVQSRERKTLDLLSKIDAFTERDESLRKDSAKAHYNMGNIYYHKGEYEIAAREYYQAVTLMPDDPDSHYNLAFVSGEHLKDFRTALKHYKMYLYLKPNAEDVDFVKEKIIAAQLVLRNAVDSPLETIDK
ncbi:MAG TPA: tetratricopeptide repeat protein [Candidatus Omnitrophota bacterium]|nr:tetratricopeptide repeat protein [Candidatus Omnitrophota bacterium]